MHLMVIMGDIICISLYYIVLVGSFYCIPSVVEFALAMTTPLSFVEVCGIGVSFMWTVLVRSMTIKGSMIKEPTTSYIQYNYV